MKLRIFIFMVLVFTVNICNASSLLERAQEKVALNYTKQAAEPCFKINKVNIERWKPVFVGGNYSRILFYDPETLEKQGKYNPFSDKVISVWLYICDGHPDCHYIPGYKFKNHVIFNLDKRTYSIDNNNKIRNIPLEPDSIYEIAYNEMRKIY